MVRSTIRKTKSNRPSGRKRLLVNRTNKKLKGSNSRRLSKRGNSTRSKVINKRQSRSSIRHVRGKNNSAIQRKTKSITGRLNNRKRRTIKKKNMNNNNKQRRMKRVQQKQKKTSTNRVLLPSTTMSSLARSIDETFHRESNFRTNE